MTDELNEPGTSIQKWADEAMFTAAPSDATEGPRVYILSAPADPLGAIAAAAKMYQGEVVRDLAEVSDLERRRYLEDMQKTKLAMPLETVQLHFLLDGVTRGFTHQLVRQRMAAYAQESMRFAVVEDSFVNRVALPPSLAGTKTWEDFLEDHQPTNWSKEDFLIWAERNEPQQAMRFRWDAAVESVQDAYITLLNQGMPAEDARGLLPTNITTRVHYITNLRSLLDHAGNRLCTQAQFEWRLVFAQLASELRVHTDWYRAEEEMPVGIVGTSIQRIDSNWQYRAIADLLKPVCYQQNKCPMKASFDRKCSIRNRVDANAQVDRPSSEWSEEYDHVHEFAGDPIVVGAGPHSVMRDENHRPVFIGAIKPAEWLADPSAAR